MRSDREYREELLSLRLALAQAAVKWAEAEARWFENNHSDTVVYLAEAREVSELKSAAERAHRKYVDEWRDAKRAGVVT